MHRNQNRISAGSAIVLLLVFLTAISLEQGLVSNSKWYGLMYITIPLLLILLIVFRPKV